MFNDSMARAFAPAEAHYKNIVITNTWGHLYPDKPQYKGKVRLVKEMYCSNSVHVLDEKNLPQSSPWWYDAITEFAFQVGLNDMEAGEVAEFDIQVDIVQCVRELEDWEAEEYKELDMEPETWQEIHIKQLAKATIVKAWS